MPFAALGSPQSWGRILIVAAHPDDEVLALGGHFGVVHPRVFHLTTGACEHSRHREQLARLREKELRHALDLGGIPRHRRFAGGVADQAAADFLPQLFECLAAVVNKVQPDCLLTHPYEGGHPDHDVAARLCSSLSRAKGGLPVYEFTSYHNGTPQAPCSTWKTAAFLPSPRPVTSIPLSRAQQKRKARLLASFCSQSEVLRLFPTTHELFRPAPQYHFDQPPHPGTLLYESFRWNVSFQSWRERISRGEKLLGIDSV